MELTADQNVFAINFFNTLRVLMKGCKPFNEKFYRTLYAEQKNNKNFRLSLNYLKKLATEEVSTSPLKNYLENKFNEVFSYLSSRPASIIDNSKEDTVKTKTKQSLSEHDENVTSSFEKSSLVKTSDHSFFKTTSFNLKKLDTSIIESKLKESAQIQDVISQIRNDDNSVDEDVVNSSLYDKADIGSVAENVANAKNEINIAQNSPADASNNIEKYTYPSENCKKLVDAIKAQNSEVIDLNEFTGICMSLKFMSRDAAIEEINDWAYENFEDPLFDVAPEENCVYITTDILDKL